MNRTVQNGIAGIVGVIVLTATLQGLYTNFVKPSLRIPLLLAGILLVAIAVYGTYAEEWRRRSGRHSAGGDEADQSAEDHPDDDHAHGHLRIGWLLLVPFLILGVAAPPPLGAYSAQTSGELTSTVQSAEGLGEISDADLVDISLTEYSARALYEEPTSMEGKTFRMTGFVTSADTAEGWVLTRMALNCCAADAYVVRVEPRGGERLPDETWVRVEGTFVATPERVSRDREPGLPVLQVSSMTPVEQPAVPYDG